MPLLPFAHSSKGPMRHPPWMPSMVTMAPWLPPLCHHGGVLCSSFPGVRPVLTAGGGVGRGSGWGMGERGDRALRSPKTAVGAPATTCILQNSLFLLTHFCKELFCFLSSWAWGLGEVLLRDNGERAGICQSGGQFPLFRPIFPAPNPWPQVPILLGIFQSFPPPYGLKIRVRGP